jgi:large subunit ribosomal protein L21
MSKFAVIKTGGKQHKVEENQILSVEKLLGEKGDKVEFETLLTADGDKLEIGKPTLAAKVKASILEQYRAKKLTIVKFRAKSRYRRKQGHRQHYTKIKIEKI